MADIAIRVHRLVERFTLHFGHFMLEPSYLVFHRAQRAEDRVGFVAHAQVAGEYRLLLEQSGAQSPKQYDLAAIGLFLPRQKAKNSGFAAAVTSHEADVLARIQLKGYAAQDLSAAVRFVNLIQPEQHW